MSTLVRQQRLWRWLALASAALLATTAAMVTPGWSLVRAASPAAPDPATCTPESEPNDLPQETTSLVGPLCQSGTLVELRDQDLLFWEVLPEDGLARWSVTVRGVPATITSIRFIPIVSAPDAVPLAVGDVSARADSDAQLGTGPITSEIRLAPGRYLLGISRGAPGFDQQLTDDRSYEIRIERVGSLPPAGDAEPNDTPTTATSLAGAFSLSGDLAGSVDTYRWTLNASDAGRPWRLESRTSMGAPSTIELRSAAGDPLIPARSATTGPDGVAVLHDLAVSAGEYLVVLSPGAAAAQPYVLSADAVTTPDVDPEPNDTAERALTMDPASLVARGRLTSDADVDQYLLDLDDALAAGLVDIDLTWSDGTVRSLCLSTETGTQVGCMAGDGHLAFAGLLLAQGRHLLSVSGTGDLDDRYELRVAPGAALPASGDREPNDDATTASPVAGAFAVSGDLTGSVPGTGDVYAWTISDADAARTWRLEASVTPRIGATVAVLWPDGSSLAWTQAGPEGTAAIPDLRLPAGTYSVWLTQAGGESPRYVVQAIEETAADVDGEPNDTTDRALLLDPASLSARGRIATGTDVDRYRLDVDDAMAATLIEVRLDWPRDHPYQLCLASENGSAVQCREARDGTALTDLLLAPGRYEIQVSGAADPDARYDLTVTAGQAPSADREVEPNDLATAPSPWDPALLMHGQALDGDVDMYRVHIDGVPQLWHLEATGAGLAGPVWTQPDGTRVGSATVSEDGTVAAIEDLFLVSGDHLLSVGADGAYSLQLTPLGPPDPQAEHEPNDDPDHAASLAVGGRRTGRLPAAEDLDVLRFSLSAPEHVVVTVDAPVDGTIGLEITSAGTSLALVAPPDSSGTTVFDGRLPAGDHELWLRPGFASDGTYVVRLARADPFITGSSAAALELPATLVMSATATEVAAFWQDGQRVDGMLRVANRGAVDLKLMLDVATSHAAWSVELPSSPIDVSADATSDIPLVIHVPADAWLGDPVRITVRARDAAGAQATAFVDITPGRDVLPVSVEQVWPVPAELLGGLDVASAALGAQPVGSHFHEQDLHDGLSIAGMGLTDSIQNGPLTLGVDLAGDDLVPVVGTILDPLAVDGTFAYRPRAFALLLSEDGMVWQQVLEGELQPQTVQQAFVLAAPVSARHAQLRIDSTWGDAPTQVMLGEWKVIAAPGFAPIPGPLNIADPRRGGHLAWSEPGSQYAFAQLLDETDTDLRWEPLEAGKAQTWVIGFVSDRAAQITGLEWIDQVGSQPEDRFGSVEVSVSGESPLGPWRALGTWNLVRSPDGSVGAFMLPEPAWARFVRLAATSADVAAQGGELPGVVRVRERLTDGEYRSILGEWGQSSPRAIRELLVPETEVAAAAGPDASDTPDQAAPLEPGTPMVDAVARGHDVDWYALTVPADQNTLTFEVRTAREGDVRLRLQDAGGGQVILEPGRTADAQVIAWTAVVEPGATYRLELTQPVLSVIVAFDTSGSVWPWFPKLRAAVRAFADDVTPGQEAVQILSFEGAALLESWSDQPYLIGGAMDAWVTAGGSSAMDASLTRSTAMLAEREGARAILLLGDAVGGGFVGGIPARALEAASPAIFPVHLGGTDDPLVSTGLMHDLAAAGHGFYQYATSQKAMERAFDRMATWLRRPSPYALSYVTSQVTYEPGSIRVVAPEGAPVPVSADVAVELVLDTSGSMLKKLGHSSRFGVARAVLTRLVGEVLPDGVPVALRTFKAKKKSCDTVLSVPLAPLDRVAMTRAITDLKIDKGTKTPIGAALARVADDLGDATGPRIVVLVTDGAETCRGDPAAEVQRLVDAGFEATINIVGFALDDPALKLQMASWATTGGGSFFDAQDQASLLSGIAASLQAPFRVFDQDGAQVGSGIVGGGGVELAPGIYRVEVQADPPRVFESVVVDPGEAVELIAGGAS